MSVTVTEKAAKEIQRFIDEGEYDQGACLRISVSGGGCSGFNYGLNIATDFDETKDNKTDQHGIAVVVDKKSDLFLDGTTVDYYEGIEQRGFQFHNPNAKKTCGCGKLFQHLIKFEKFRIKNGWFRQPFFVALLTFTNRPDPQSLSAIG